MPNVQTEVLWLKIFCVPNLLEAGDWTVWPQIQVKIGGKIETGRTEQMVCTFLGKDYWMFYSENQFY